MRIFQALISVMLGLVSMQAHANEAALDKHFRLIVDDPRQAEQLFLSDGTYKARLYLAILYSTSLNGEAGATQKAEELFEKLKKEFDLRRASRVRYIKWRFEEVLSVPSVDQIRRGEFYHWIRYLSLAATKQMGLMKTPIVLDCRLIQEDPSLLSAIYPSYIYDVVEFLPQTNCLEEHARLPDTYGLYREYTERNMVTTYFNDENLLRHSRRAWDRYQEVAVALFPDKIDDAASAYSNPNKDWLKAPCDVPYVKWGHLSLSNWRKFQEAKSLHGRAVENLAAYYRDTIGLPEYRANNYASVAMAAFGGEWQKMGCPVGSLRNKILEGVALSIIKRELAEGSLNLVTNPAEEFGYGYPGSYLRMEMNWATGEPESLLHIAVTRPDVLGYLLPRFPSVETPNSFGKTPLMTAAQYNVAASVKLLLDAGADVNAKTGRPGFPEQLAYNFRTPLMYAAANADLEVIELLLDAGASTQAIDSKGHRALDYLHGFPAIAPKQEFDRGTPDVSGNSRLKPEELKRAVALLKK